MIGRLIAAVLLVAVVAACSGTHSGGAPVATRSIDEVLVDHTDSLMAIPGVVGTAVGLCDGERCIKVLLADSNPETKRKIPARLEGYRVVVEVTGTIRPR
ncbi:MAG: hypothetical protein DMD38_12610 [Gemmatimonadetes bacterium]|nr:MAG: hypothetical protein DMD38_12610 [Gemmatimonadota bacterium]